MGVDQVSPLIIAHRGLTDGPDDILQNQPQQVDSALAEGFDAEVDLWYAGNKWWLGHDTPTYEVSWEWLGQEGLWLHCKNLPAFFRLKQRSSKHNYFFHDSDLIVLTSRGYVWTYFGHRDTASKDSICVMPEVSYDWDEVKDMILSARWLGYCTDHARKIASMLV